jgi:hypothetical protein
MLYKNQMNVWIPVLAMQQQRKLQSGINNKTVVLIENTAA